jgi:hypothetical protein
MYNTGGVGAERIVQAPLDSLDQRNTLLSMIHSTVSSTEDIALLEHNPTLCLVAVQPLPHPLQPGDAGAVEGGYHPGAAYLWRPTPAPGGLCCLGH